MEISYAGSKRCRVILIQTQNPKSKSPRFGAATKRTKTKLSQNPKSKTPNPKSKLQNPRSKTQKPKSKLQTPNPKIQIPNSKIQTARLEFGFGRVGAGGDGHVANEDVWPCWPPDFGLVGGLTSLQPKGSRLDSTHGRAKLGTDCRREVLLETEPRFPAPCRGNLGSVSGETTGQAALLKTLGRHRAAPTMCVSARGVNIA